jgi:hypothetical protein
MVKDVEKRWIDRNIDLSLLCDQFGIFLRKKGFKTSKIYVKPRYEVVGTFPKELYSYEIVVLIHGRPEDFVLKLALKDQAGIFQKLSSLSALFGGGSLVLKSLRSQELFDKLEEEFWVFAEETVANMATDAKFR